MFMYTWLYSGVPYLGWFRSQGDRYTPNLSPYSLQASLSSFSTLPWPFRQGLCATVCVEYRLGQRQNPSWCFAVMMIPAAPAALAIRAHWRQSRAVGLKTASCSVPFPHSRSVKVLGP